MTQDEIIEMAKFAGIRIDSFGFQGGFIEEFEAFAKLAADKEREACAKVCDGYIGADPIAAAIRARGEA